MDSSLVLSFLLFIFLFHFSYRVTGQKSCQTYTCSDSTGPAIRFPFRIEGLQQETCGYPGFDLKCSKQSNTILEIPSSGRFWLQEIDYTKQEIGIVDPDNCLWRKLRSLNLSGSPFKGFYYENYWMVKCSTKLTMVSVPPSKFIDCMSNSSYNVWATASEVDALMMLPMGCELIATMSVPVPWSGYYENGDQTSFNGQRENLVLKWDEPYCADCEAKGGRCGRLQSNSSLEVGCFDVSRTRHVLYFWGKTGLPRSVSYAVTIGVGIPVLLCGIGLACYVGDRVKRYRRRNTHVAEAGSSSIINSQPIVIVVGLDNTTIESYPKVVLGESCRLPKPNDNTCSICLAEYQPKETLRTIPQCQHCFHADCIDEWLRTNATCPLCRTSPAPLSSAHSPP
ncbi:putative RING-H2 finger protein ATL21A [Telopea speciosissima]|uniref:putative RING-H2 finger protein ATL21A n=1 Tax=Telopea speciosissima TaxID=54955 RepID=UPI001CC4A73F|nr:putative RING-H2 finger protein ATL21A [Telopea speciosissima]